MLIEYRIQLKSLYLSGIVCGLFLLSSCSNNHESDSPRKINIGKSVYEESQVRGYLREIFRHTLLELEKEDREEFFKSKFHFWEDEVRYLVFTTSDIKREVVQNFVSEYLEILSAETGIDFIQAKGLNDTDMLIGIGSTFEPMKGVPLFRKMLLHSHPTQEQYDQYWDSLVSSRSDYQISHILGTKAGEKSSLNEKENSLIWSFGVAKIPPDKVSDYEYIFRRTAYSIYTNMYVGAHTSKKINESFADNIGDNEFPYIGDFDRSLLRHMYAIPQKDDKTIEEVIEILVEKLMTEYKAEKAD